MKTCEKCNRPRFPRRSLCKMHYREHQNTQARARRAAVHFSVPDPGDRETRVYTGPDETPPAPFEPPTIPEPPVMTGISAWLPDDPLPLYCEAPGYKASLVMPGSPLKRVLFIPDVHRPYHDKRAWATMIKAARVFKPDKIVVLGDFGDYYAASSFAKDPRRKLDLKWETDDANAGLDELDSLGAFTKLFIAGNHEDRLERYLMSSAPALIGVTSVPELYRLAERGWQYTPYKRSTRSGKLRVTHDTGTAGQNAHRQSVDAFQASTVIGHTHRMEMSFKGNADGKPTVGAMFGWLGDFDQIDYMQQVKARRDWVHGFGIGYEEANGVTHLQCVPIIEGRCVINGELIS